MILSFRFHGQDLVDDDSGSSLISDSTAKLNQQVASFLLAYKEIFPCLVTIVPNARARSFSSEISSPKLNISLDFSKTWCQDPTPSIANDTVGVWPPSTAFPSWDRHFTPPDCQLEMPLQLPVHFPDSKLEKFLKAKCLMHNNTVSLNPLVFEPCEIKLESGSNVHNIDALARKAILENAIVDTLVESTVNLTGHFLDNTNLLNDAAAVLDKISLLNSSLRLAWSANLRCRTFLIDIFC